MILTLESRENLNTIFLLVRLRLLLLPGLFQRCEVTHSRDLVPSCFKFVLLDPSALQNRRVDCVQYKIVLRACKVQQAETVNVLLVLGRRGDLISQYQLVLLIAPVGVEMGIVLTR